MTRSLLIAAIGAVAATGTAIGGVASAQDFARELGRQQGQERERGFQNPDDAEMPEQSFGWQQEPQPVIADELERPLSELERLSLSSSGMNYGRNTYDPRTDNPLEPVSVTLRALDKITARYTDLVIDMNGTSQFGTLAITPRTCDKRPPEEVPEITAFLEIEATDDFVRLPGTTAEGVEDAAALDDASLADDEIAAVPAVESSAMAPLEGEEAVPESVVATGPQSPGGGLSTEDDDRDSTLFQGWMFASSPALNALEHPVYDVWVIDCKMVDPSI